MRRNIYSVLLLALILPVIGFAQNTKTGKDSKLPFAKVIGNEGERQYVSVDLTQLPTFFERAYLLDQIFKDSKLVINNSNISGDALELFTDNQTGRDELQQTLEHYRDAALAAEKNLNQAQKKELMKKYEKYR